MTVNPGVYPLCRPRGEPSTIADGTLAAVLRASKRADDGALDQIKQVWLYRKTRPSQKEAMQRSTSTSRRRVTSRTHTSTLAT